jgi:TPR repeat protein
MSSSPSSPLNKFRNYHIALKANGAPVEIKSFQQYTERLLLGFDPHRRQLVTVEVCELPESQCAEAFTQGDLNVLEKEASDFRIAGHPAFVPVLEVGNDEGIFYAVREWVSGATLEDYIGTVGRKLPIWSALDLGLQYIDVLESLANKPELVKRLDASRAIVTAGFGGRLRLRIDGFVLHRQRESISSEASGQSALVQKVCEFLHYIFCSRWMPVDNKGRKSPVLGELPESLRYLIWAAFQRNAAQGAENIDQMREALKRIKDGIAERPLAAAFLPVCRMRSHLSGKQEIGEMFGNKYRLDVASNPMIEEFLPQAYEQRLIQHPFGYSMRLHVVPTGKMIGDARYEECLDQLLTPKNVSNRNILRACDYGQSGDMFFIVEEDINGFSLEELAVRRGGFDTADALFLAEQIHEALKSVESGGRWIWDLAPENVMAHFESRHSGEELFAAMDAPVEEWPKFKIVLRLHPTMASLTRGSSVEWKNADTEDAPLDNLREHTSASLAALVWRLLSFNPYVLQPIRGGKFHQLRRLTNEGNDLLKGFIMADEFPADATASRQHFLNEVRESMRSGVIERNEVMPKLPIPLPVMDRPKAFVPSGNDSRRLHEEARERLAAEAGNKRKFSQKVKAVFSGAVSLKNVSYKRIVFHASMAALICGLAAMAFLLVNSGTRGQMISYLGGVIDRVIGKETSQSEQTTEKASVAPKAKAEEMVPVVAKAPTSIKPIAVANVENTCVPPKDLAANEPPAQAVLPAETLDETAFVPNPAMAVEVLDEMLKTYRQGAQEIRDNEEMLLRAAGAGSREALVMLGDLFKNSDTSRAIQFYEKASKTGHAAGMNAYADCLWSGIGVVKNRDEALKIYLKAADERNVHALEKLGELHVTGAIPDGAGGRSRLEILKAASEVGSGKSSASLGVLYLNGLGVAKDSSLAAEYFEKSALAGSVDGMLYYARCLHGGIGIDSNRKASRLWFRKSAVAGNELALKWCRQNGETIGE